jgi:hypothetical protein
MCILIVYDVYDTCVGRGWWVQGSKYWRSALDREHVHEGLSLSPCPRVVYLDLCSCCIHHHYRPRCFFYHCALPILCCRCSLSDVQIPKQVWQCSISHDSCVHALLSTSPSHLPIALARRICPRALARYFAHVSFVCYTYKQIPHIISENLAWYETLELSATDDLRHQTQEPHLPVSDARTAALITCWTLVQHRSNNNTSLLVQR